MKYTVLSVKIVSISKYFDKIINLFSQSKNKIILDAEKFWRLSKTDPNIQDLSHWRGKGRWTDDELWQSIGKQHFSIFKQIEFKPIAVYLQPESNYAYYFLKKGET